MSLTFSIACNMYLFGVAMVRILPNLEFIIRDKISSVVMSVDLQPYTFLFKVHGGRCFLWPFSKSHRIIIEIVGVLEL